MFKRGFGKCRLILAMTTAFALLSIPVSSQNGHRPNHRKTNRREPAPHGRRRSRVQQQEEMDEKEHIKKQLEEQQAAPNIYPDDHWDYSTELTVDNFNPTVQKEIDAGRTFFVRFIASHG